MICAKTSCAAIGHWCYGNGGIESGISKVYGKKRRNIACSTFAKADGGVVIFPCESSAGNRSADYGFRNRDTAAKVLIGNGVDRGRRVYCNNDLLGIGAGVCPEGKVIGYINGIVCGVYQGLVGIASAGCPWIADAGNVLSCPGERGAGRFACRAVVEQRVAANGRR